MKRKIVLSLTLIFMINLIFNSCVLSVNTSNKIIYVDDDGGADYIKIQEAIDAANPDDIIFVYSGIYNENLLIDKTLIIEGENSTSTNIDGLESGSTIKITANNVEISGFTITNSLNSSEAAGIYISADQITISNNNISHNLGYGIYTENTNGHEITGNIISKNNYDGIYLRSSYGNIITNNTISYHYYLVYMLGQIPRSHGVYLYDVSTSIVSDNLFSDNINSDLSVIFSSGINIENNEFIGGSGIFISGELPHLTSHTIENNHVNDKPIYYYKNDHNGGIVPDDAGQIILVDCRGFTISNLSINGGDYGIILWYSENNIISNNHMSNLLDGYYLLYSNNNIITNNLITNVWGNPLEVSDYNHVNYNRFENNTRYGTGCFTSSNNSIYHNTINNCIEPGILLTYSDNNIIALNNIQNCTQSGIYLSNSRENTIAGNFLEYNNDNGIEFGFSSSYNIVHHNNLIGNMPKNGYDAGRNTWDLGNLGGNYWDDYNGIDNDGDGYGDEPYIVKGTNKDNYPQMSPIVINYPNKPDRPIGPSSGKINNDLTYIFKSIDSEDFHLFYYVDWGDKSNNEWYGPYPSGQSVEITHNWLSQGEYNIRTKVINILGAESEWSDPLSVSVSMPRNKPYIDRPFRWFLEDHPYLFPILRQLLIFLMEV